jgi:hypothetical protein
MGEGYLEGAKVNHVVDVGVLSEDLVQSRFVCHVGFVEGGLLAADHFNAVQHLLGGIVQVVDDDDLVIGLQQRERCERADVARSTASTSVCDFCI